MEFKKLQILNKAPNQKSQIQINEFWKNFKSPSVLKESGQVSNLHFSPNNNGQLAVTSGCKVSIYNTSTNSVFKNISRFTDMAYSGTIRNDGKLMLAGDASGLVQIFDLSSRSILRTFKGHNGSVPCTKFMPDVQQILTASYDKTVKIWDVPSQSDIISFAGHEDYIKTASVNPSNPSQIISGSYDHCIKLWDVRSGTCTATFNHQAPIESLSVFGNGGMVAVGGGPSIQIYDLISGKSLITLDNFQKTVTCVKLTSDNNYLMGGSLDRYVKCYDTSDWSLCNSVKFPGMVSAIDISNDNSHMVVGMTTGIFSIQSNKSQQQQKQSVLSRADNEFGTSKLKRKYENLPNTETVIEVPKEPKQVRYRQFDILLRKFKYKEALDAATKTHDPSLGFALISELIRRGGLVTALSGRDDMSLLPIISYLARNLRNYHDKALIIDVSDLVMQLYGDVLFKSKHLDIPLRRLMTSVQQEKKMVQNLIQFQGKVGLLLAKVNKVENL